MPHLVLKIKVVLKTKSKQEKKVDLEIKTKINLEEKIKKVIINKTGIIRKDSICTIHLVKHFGTPLLVYDYNGDLSFNQRTDRFFLQVFLKDDSEWAKINDKEYIDLDFNSKPFEFSIKSEKHNVFTRAISSEFVQFDNIKKISTGRYKAGRGKSYGAYHLKVNKINDSGKIKNLETLTINIKEKEFNKIKEKREKAFHNRILITEDRDEVKASINFLNDNSIKVKMRLKGDWTDHLVDDKKWSFRLITSDGLL